MVRLAATVYPLILVLVAAFANNAIALYQGVAYNITFPSGLNATASGWLVAPGYWSSLSVGATCLSPVNSTALHVDGFTFFVFRDTVGAGESRVYSVCNYTAAASDGFVHHERLVLVASCPGEDGSETLTGYSSNGEVVIEHRHDPWFIAWNDTVYVWTYLYPLPANVNVYVCTDAGSCQTYTYTVRRLGETFTIVFAGPWNTTTLTVIVNTTATYYQYLYVESTVYYTLPTSNETNATLGPFQAALIDAAGMGFITAGPYRASIKGFYRLVATPYGASMNGTYANIAISNITVAAYCFGVDATSILVVDYYASNLTSEEVELLYSFTEEEPATPLGVYELQVNASIISEAIENATAQQVRLFARVLAGSAALLASLGFATNPMLSVVGGAMGAAAILAGASVGDTLAMGAGAYAVIALLVTIAVRAALEGARWLTR